MERCFSKVERRERGPQADLSRFQECSVRTARPSGAEGLHPPGTVLDFITGLTSSLGQHSDIGIRPILRMRNGGPDRSNYSLKVNTALKMGEIFLLMARGRGEGERLLSRLHAQGRAQYRTQTHSPETMT